MTIERSAKVAEWDVAGLMSRSSGALGRPTQPGSWSTPAELALDVEGYVTWNSRTWKRVVPPVDLLDRFVKLAHAPDGQAFQFAKAFSVVALCEEHRLPLTHSRLIGEDPSQHPSVAPFWEVMILHTSRSVGTETLLGGVLHC